eukprot:1384586-Rhodomonas_salina.4
MRQRGRDRESGAGGGGARKRGSEDGLRRRKCGRVAHLCAGGTRSLGPRRDFKLDIAQDY